MESIALFVSIAFVIMVFVYGKCWDIHGRAHVGVVLKALAAGLYLITFQIIMVISFQLETGVSE